MEQGWQKVKRGLKKTWNFLWHSDSWLSWVVDIILAFVLIKFIVYPVLGLVLATSHPIVAVVSSSMEHDGSFEQWWSGNLYCANGNCSRRFSQESLYANIGIEKVQFKEFPYKNGFNKGDLIILASGKNLEVGDIVVFNADHRFDPIIHRIVLVKEKNGQKYYETKGDHNPGSSSFEKNIPQEKIIGKAVARVPLLGWIKIGFVTLIQLFIGA